MKVLQLIDSLHAGGAERVAVNFANSLVPNIEASYLCASREEGMLKESLSKDVGYLFLNKKSTLDVRAISTLYRFIKHHKITIIHAHASSFFMATIMKLLNLRIVLIWHDHFGNSEYLNKRSSWMLKLCSLFFSHVLCVNSKLEVWAKEYLGIKTVSYLPNYSVLYHSKKKTKLQGMEGKRILCLANLRPQKDHLNLLKAYALVAKEHADWSLHLVGQDFEDDYSKAIKQYIQHESLSEQVFMYGSCPDAFHVLSQSTIGILSSKSEGLPLALLEYGLAELPVIATQVGDCHQVISNTNEGVLVAPEHHDFLANALLLYINDLDLRRKVAKNLHLKVLKSFSEVGIMDKLIEIYKTHQK